MIIFARLLFKYRHYINVTRVFDVNESHPDALDRGIDE